MTREPNPLKSAKTAASLPLVEDGFEADEPPEIADRPLATAWRGHEPRLHRAHAFDE